MIEPIRSITDIKKMQTYLAGKRMRDFVLFNFGLNTGLRISDIVRLQWSDVFNDGGDFRQYLTIKEQKTKKIKRIKLNDKLKKYLKTYKKQQNPPSIWIFPSRKKGGHISTVQAYRLLRSAAEAVGIENFGTHTMRKTFGYFVYQKTKNIGLLMDLFNHASPRITLRYIGINQDAKDEIVSVVQF